MSPASVLDVVLAAAVLAVALVAVLLPSRRGAVSAFLVLGVVLAVLWARLDAPDIALAEAALGSGVAGALLMDTLTADPARPGRRAGRTAVVVGLLAGAVALAALTVVVRAVPDEPSLLPAAVAEEIHGAGADHAVTAVLLNFRSLDTLLEAAVLVFAAAGAGALVRTPVRAPDPVPAPVTALARVLLPALVLLGTWLLLAGTSRPGGAFQAGAMFAGALVVAFVAGARFAASQGTAARAWTVAGVLAFVALAAGTAMLGQGWLVLDPRWAGAAVLTVETVLAVSIGVGLAQVFVANSEARRVPS
ncbi:hypothetical protein DNL40_04605 [Xylanimonas oleitrophica]|uniref:DUF4040 domain-containing protein n=1 Tax=Xylanimonas oleitrophica TaxID=2607479 RepID=A0A2W5WSV9_9MICO|nr:MnhB domain-containing protein [Xylanimonas oleitrophica]PZR54210.1 hypothetical protein DNL40_04605 [Xylanimonas oleitrophica]